MSSSSGNLLPEKQPELCENCNKPVLVMIFRGTRHCSEICRKQMVGEPFEEKPLAP